MISEELRLRCLSISADNVDDYIASLVQKKREDNTIGWQDIANLVEEKFNVLHSRHWYYRNFGDLLLNNWQDSSGDISDLEKVQKEKVKLSDIMIQNRAYVRRLAREETIKEIANDVAAQIGARKILPTYRSIIQTNKDKEAVVLLSDWHYGIEVNNAWNMYNTEIAKERISTLLNSVITICRQQDIQHLHILNLSDLIAGRIHLTIRLESRIDVITQIIEVSEILCEFLNSLSQYFKVDYYSCTDNHSRIEPDKTQSLDLESLCRITDWYLMNRLGNSITFHQNKFGDDIITLNVLGHNIAGVHGHLDRPQTTISSLSSFTRMSYDLICSAHLHHFSMDEECGCRIICNGSLMGTDDYAKQKRLHSRPSQTIVVVSKDCICDSIHIIEL